MASCEQLSQELFVNSNHFCSAFKAMDSMRKGNQFCDISLEVVSTQTALTKRVEKSVSEPTIAAVRAHKVVLASVSDYFNHIFNNKINEQNKADIKVENIDTKAYVQYNDTVVSDITDSNKLRINDIDLKSLVLIVDYAYSGQLCLTRENVQSVLLAAKRLQVSTLLGACTQFRIICPANCLSIRRFADSHACEELQTTAHKYSLENFDAVLMTEEFLLLSFTELEVIISSEELNVSKEENVFNAVMAWIRHDLKTRERHLRQVLKHLRLMDRTFLLERVSTDPLMSSDQRRRDLLNEALIHHLSGGKDRIDSTVSSEKSRAECLKSYIFVIGGEDYLCEYYNPISDKWTHFTPTSKQRYVSVALNQLLCTIGGRDGNETLSSAEVFNPFNNKWTDIKPMNAKRSGLGVTALNETIYVCGGWDGHSYLKSVERYDPLVDKWTSMQTMNANRSYCRLCAFNGCLFVVGGKDGSNYLSSMERMDPREGKWVSMPDMMSLRSGCGVAVLDGLLYSVGGYNGSDYLNSCERFDPKSNSWQTIECLRNKRDGLELVECEGQLYAIGGRARIYSGWNLLGSIRNFNSVERYDPNSNEWSYVSAMNRQRFYLCSTVLSLDDNVLDILTNE